MVSSGGSLHRELLGVAKIYSPSPSPAVGRRPAIHVGTLPVPPFGPALQYL